MNCGDRKREAGYEATGPGKQVLRSGGSWQISHLGAWATS